MGVFLVTLKRTIRVYTTLDPFRQKPVKYYFGFLITVEYKFYKQHTIEILHNDS